MSDLLQFRLRDASPPAKVMIIGFLLSLGLAYLYAVVNIGLVVGLTPKDIAVHYYGAETVIQETVAPTGEEVFDLDSLDVKPQVTMGPRPSFKNLVQEGHFHLFGMTTFFFLLTFLGLFTGVKDSFKVYLMGVPFVAVVLDNISFMATRFVGPKLSYLTALSGAVMGITFSILWVVVLLEVFKKRETL